MRELSNKEVGQVSGGFFLLKGLFHKKASLLGGLFGKFSQKKSSPKRRSRSRKSRGYSHHH